MVASGSGMSNVENPNSYPTWLRLLLVVIAAGVDHRGGWPKWILFLAALVAVVVLVN